MSDVKMRKHFGDYLGMAEVLILTILAILISLTAFVAKMFAHFYVRHWRR